MSQRRAAMCGPTPNKNPSISSGAGGVSKANEAFKNICKTFSYVKKLSVPLQGGDTESALICY